MSTQVSASNLTQAVRDLMTEWSHTRAYWRDAKTAEFHEKYLDKLPAYASQTKHAMEELNTLLRKVRQDCE